MSVVGCEHMRSRPEPPTKDDILKYRSQRDCGLYTAKENLMNEYQEDLQDWILDMIGHLLDFTHRERDLTVVND